MTADGRMWGLDPAGSAASAVFNSGTQAQITLKVPVMEGDIVVVGSGIDTSSANPGDILQDATYGQFKDNLGNSYQRAGTINDAAKAQGTTLWLGTVTRPGTVTVTQMALPTPGTTTLGSAFVQIDRLVGPGKGVSWALDGAAATAVVVAPGTGADAINSGNVATKLRAGMLVAFVQDNSTSVVINPGTGFTGGAGGATTGSLTEFKVAAGPGNLAATATTPAGGADDFGIVAAVISWPLVDGDTGGVSTQQRED